MRPPGDRLHPDVVHHEAAFAHMQICPLAISPEMLARLDARERALGVRLPGALREWYALVEAWDDLRSYTSNILGDAFHPVEELGEAGYILLADGTLRSIVHVATGHLPVMAEYQGDAYWALALDGSDDPPVMVAETPLRMPAPETLPPAASIDAAMAAAVAWMPHAPSFSTFILARTWRRRFTDRYFILQAYQDEPISPDDLKFLRANLREGPASTNWPSGTIEYRFGDAEEGVVWISSSVDGEPRFWRFEPGVRFEPPQACACMWGIWASTPSGLEGLDLRVLNCGQLRERVFGLCESGELGRRLRQAGP